MAGLFKIACENSVHLSCTILQPWSADPEPILSRKPNKSNPKIEIWIRFGKIYTPENEHSPWKGTIPKGKLIFQPSFFRGYVNFQGSNEFPFHLTKGVKISGFQKKKLPLLCSVVFFFPMTFSHRKKKTYEVPLKKPHLLHIFLHKLHLFAGRRVGWGCLTFHCPWRIHGTNGICTDPWMVDFYGFHVGKYTVRPMDP